MRWRRDKGRMTLAVVSLAALLLAAGCSPAAGVADEDESVSPTPDPPEHDREAIGEPEPEPASTLVLTDWRSPHDLRALVAMFEQLAWSLTLDGQEILVEHRVEGLETIDDRDTVRTTFYIDTTDMEGGFELALRLWAEEATGEIVRAELAGDEIEPFIADSMVRGALAMVLLPFTLLDEFGADLLVGGGPGWEWHIESRATRQLGPLLPDVHHVVVDVQYDEIWQTTQDWFIADFGGFQMLIEWTAIAIAEDTGQKIRFTMKIDRVVPR